MYECNHCDFTTDSERGLSSHTSQAHKGPQKKEYVCETCGTTFTDYPSRREGRGRESFYCSVDCKNRGAEKETFDVNCAWCGSGLTRHPSHVNQMGEYTIDNHFCDKDCESSWKREHWTGEDHPSWDGGHERDYGENWTEHRRAALAQAEYRCELCDMTRDEHYTEYGFDLDVHHRIPLDAFDEPEDANFQNNLIVACRHCHQSVLEQEPVPHNGLIAAQ